MIFNMEKLSVAIQQMISISENELTNLLDQNLQETSST